LARVSLPVGGGGAGGGVSFSQQAETPSVAAVKAAKTKYLTKFIVLNRLKPDFHLTSKQPALVGVAIVRRIRTTGVAAFTSWRGCPFQRTAPDRVSGE
jgi:hypothetical protein